jgi:hypothetical protein
MMSEGATEVKKKRVHFYRLTPLYREEVAVADVENINEP